MSDTSPLRLATRGSDLARRQAATVQSALEERRLDVELVEIETTGDKVRDELIHRLGKTGAFVRALDEAVLEGEVDAAVHSMKDMPTEQPDDLVVAAVPERGAAGDVLVTPEGVELKNLPRGATVGTGSLRRGAQLRANRPDLNVEPLRGNVDTRVEKLLAPVVQAEHERRSDAEAERKEDLERETRTEEAVEDTPEGGYDDTVEEWFGGLSEIERRAAEREVETEYDAIVLARAGLERTGLVHTVGAADLPTNEFVPAAGQGALAVTAADGEIAERIQGYIDDPRSRAETAVERTVLAEVGGGCIAPIGVHAVLQGDHIHTAARVLSEDGGEEAALTRDLPADAYLPAARELAADLRGRGAAELIDAAREGEP
jgi:hydroxymethylbilane synthase